MTEPFDPYSQWLDIREVRRPPYAYALLGLANFTEDEAEIAKAAEQRTAQVRRLATKEQAATAHKLLKELAAARALLLNPQKKAAYDAELRKRLRPSPEGDTLLPPQSVSSPVAAVPVAAPRTVSAAPVPDLQFDPTTVAPRIKRRRKSGSPWLMILGALGFGAVGVAALAVAHRQGLLGARQGGEVALVQAVTPEPAQAEQASLPSMPRPTKPKRIRPRPSQPASDETSAGSDPPASDEMPADENASATEPSLENAGTENTSGDLPSAASTPEVQLPVPEAKSLREALPEIRKRFAFDYEKAQSIVDFRTFGRKLYEAAIKPDERPELRFVMFEESRRLFTESNATPAALEVINAQARAFQIDPLPLKAEVLETIAPRLEDPEALFDHVQAMLDTAQGAMWVDDYRVAQQLSRGAIPWAKKLADPLLDERVKDFQRVLRECQQAYNALAEQREALRANPEDRAAHTALGRFAATHQGNFAAAVVHLAAGESGPWQVAGQRELEHPGSPADQAAAGDAWWDASADLDSAEQAVLRQRALFWYERAIPKLSGAEQMRLQQRVAELFGRTKIWKCTPDNAEGLSLGHPEANLPDEATLEFWFATRDETITLLTKRGEEQDSSLSLVVRGGRLVVSSEGDKPGEFDTRALVGDCNWHHVALVRQAARLHVFLDGRSLGRHDLAGALKSSSPWKAGFHPVRGATQSAGNGQFARVRLSNVARYQYPFQPPRNYGRDRRTVFIE